MEINTSNSYCLIGLPRSGKSTFIAALWHIVDSEEIEDSIVIKGLPEEREYLNKLRDAWLSFQEFERTKVENKHHVTLTVSGNDHVISELKFPDVSGEMYNIQFESRKLELEYLKMIQSSNGIMLFINPSFIEEPQLISNIDALIGNGSDQNDIIEIKKWEFKDTPTQVKLVDLLQMILFNIDQPIKVAIIVSAWDEIIKQNIKPAKWVETSLPLLYQFLNSNNLMFKSNFFGISAQGGSYSEYLNELEKKIPSERIIVETNNETSNDITLPIKWLLKNE
jgi:hypothetical protein